MKIWFAADIPEKSFGGVSRSLKELSGGLKNRGHVVTVITRSTYSRGNYLIFAFKLCIRFVFNLFSRPDCIIARSTDAVFCAVIIRLLRLNTGIILHNHGWEENVYEIEKKLAYSVLSTPTTWKSIIIRFPLLRLMLKLCTFCMSGTVHECRYLKARYPALGHKFIYIPNGVAVQENAPRENKGSYPMDFIFIGNTTWKKNLFHAAAIFSYIKKTQSNTRLFCIGTGLDDKAVFSILGYDIDGIVNMRSVSFEEMQTWYSRCPFMLAPSRFEGGHPLAVLEAMSFGILVFASAIPSHTEIIHDGKNGYLISGADIENDARYIIEKLFLEGNRKIRERAIQTAQRNRWPRQISRLERVLCRNR
jgi:glycosyltransferase involved in cell wall biosynthesis